MKKICLVGFLLLTACIPPNVEEPISINESVVKKLTIVNSPLSTEAPFYIAVYQFSDKTGQRRPSEVVAHLSSAVTQGAETWLIKALQDAGNGSWFKVVERVGLENLTRERQLIRQTREQYEGKDAKPLRPLVFASLILEGGIIGYDVNTISGGIGARYLGIGPSTQYRQDQVTIVMRLISVQTGEVLLNVATSKTILSSAVGIDVFKFVDAGTRAVEIETGLATNEPVNYAVRAAIEAGVVELIQEGARKGLWRMSE
jgi:curli production assembly/transport component CsgG